MKQKKQLTVLIVLLLIAGAIWFFYFDRDKPAVTADAGSAAHNPQLLSVENPGLHKYGVEKARKTEYKSSGRNIFSRDIPAPQPTQTEIKKAKEQREQELVRVAQQPPDPPKVSPLPAKFFGYGTIPNGTARVAFLNSGEDGVFVVKEGELFLNRFRIIKIGTVNLEYEEISSGLRGTAPLEEQGGPPSA